MDRSMQPTVFISIKVFWKSFCRGQLPHKSGNLSLTFTYIKNELTDLCGSGLLQDDRENTLCGTNLGGGARVQGLKFDKASKLLFAQS